MYQVFFDFLFWAINGVAARVPWSTPLTRLNMFLHHMGPLKKTEDIYGDIDMAFKMILRAIYHSHINFQPI